MIKANLQFFGGRGASAGLKRESERQQMINELLDMELLNIKRKRRNSGGVIK